jgi:hypothetical protein
VLSQAHGFSGLIRGKMQEVFNQKERHPGDICVTDSRGWPQLNVVGSTADDAQPQLVWLEKFQTPLGDEVSGNSLVTEIARGRKEKIRGAQQSLAFAKAELDGCNVTDPVSPVRILPNSVHPQDQRRVSRIAPAADAAENDVGIAFPTGDVLTDVDGKEQIRRAIEEEAERLGKTVAFLFQPANLAWVLAHSRIMKLLLQRAANGHVHGEGAQRK